MWNKEQKQGFFNIVINNHLPCSGWVIERIIGLSTVVFQTLFPLDLTGGTKLQRYPRLKLGVKT